MPHCERNRSIRIKICRQCSSEFIVSTRHPEQEFCGRSCARLMKIALKRAFGFRPKNNCKRIVKQVVCLFCKKTFLTRNFHKKLCSNQCTKQRHRLIYQTPKLVIHCKWCGISCVRVKQSVLCRECRSYNEWIINKRVKTTRRARKRGVYAESFSSIEIFNRDRWTCQLCHSIVSIDVPSTDPLRAELDHIIPISKGGPHTRANTQCLCRRCNNHKSDSIPALV
jgi:5-methylcytosine-specific restriction endonuclease McrA